MSAGREPEIACIAVPALPLQLVLRARPDWREDPLVVVEDDRPLARVLWANRAARRGRVRPGIRFAEARSLLARLRGVPFSAEDALAAQEELFRLLLSFSPRVEPGDGVFWADPRGLGRLYASPGAWAARLHEAIGRRSLAASVVLGWRRACVLALARASTGSRVLDTPEEEAREADSVPLLRLELPPDLARELGLLGVATFGEFRKLPQEGVAARFGEEALALHRFATARAWTPLTPVTPQPPVRQEIPVEPPDDDRNRLLFAVKGALHGIVKSLRKQSRAVSALEIRLDLDHAPEHCERLETAAPTLDVIRLVDLVRLRLSSVELEAPVERVRLDVLAVRVSPDQITMLETPPLRDPAAAESAIARIRAAFGESSVVRARLVDAHLPEARFRWETQTKVSLPDPPETPQGPLPLVRSLLPAPVPLPDLPRHERERWLGKHGAVLCLQGPDRVGSLWWDQNEERDYFLAETRTGEILWMYRDRIQRRWYLHGFVD